MLFVKHPPTMSKMTSFGAFPIYLFILVLSPFICLTEDFVMIF